jgi:uncharacterized protein (TIGR00162 family)
LVTKIQISTTAVPRLHDPVMVCGLPDSGNVAKLVIDQLVNQLKATRYAEIYSYSLPAKVMMNKDGTVEPMRHSLFYWTNANGAHDLLLYTGDAQPTDPEAAYELADRALEMGKTLGAELVFAVGAYITGEFAREPRVFGTGTDPGLLGEFEKIGVSPIKEGSITWMNGLLVGLSKLRGLKAVFLSGETSGYVVDALAARAVLRILSEKLGLPIDTAELEQMAKQSEPMIKSMQEIQARARAENDDMGYIG